MGFISKIFGAIFGFFGSLLSTVGKVFGLGGKSGYFLELDEESSADAPAKSAAPTPAKQPEKAPEASAKSSAKPKSDSVKPTVSAKSEEEQVPASVINKPQATSTNIGHSNGSASMNNGKVIPGLTFAPDAMVSASSGGRRRPGPSLAPFKVMARDMQR